MRGVVLQPWVTVKGSSSVTSFTQSEVDWLDCAPYQDYLVWLEVKELSDGGAVPAWLFLETAPTKEELLFSPSGGAHPIMPLAVGVFGTKNILNGQAALQIPLGRWLRWRISMGAPSATWSVTFQIHLALHSTCLPAVG
jgi:hypothetical protein